MPPKKVLGPGTKFEDLLAANKALNQKKSTGSAKAAATISTDASTQAAAKPKKQGKTAAKKASAKVIKASLSAVAEKEGMAMVAEHAPPVVVKPELQELKASTKFTEEEDFFLCKAFVNVSTDSTVGCNQKAEIFWNNVKERMYEMYDEQAEVVIPGRRHSESLKNRFQKTISNSALKFTLYYRQIVGVECNGKPPSGFDQNGLMNAAVEAYDRMERKPFKLRKCVTLLWVIPKYNPLVDPKGDEELSVATGTGTKSTSVMGSNLDRPACGVKKAKKQKLLEKLDGVTTPAMRSMDVNNAVMKSMDETSRFKAHQQSYSVRAQIYIKLGKMAEAEQCLDLMARRQELDLKRPSVEIPQDHKALPTFLVAEKQTGPSPLTVEGLQQPSKSFPSTDGDDEAASGLFGDEEEEESSSSQEIVAPIPTRATRATTASTLFPEKPKVKDLSSSDDDNVLSARAKLQMAQRFKNIEQNQSTSSEAEGGSSSENSLTPV
jgi:hypothetical protein